MKHALVFCFLFFGLILTAPGQSAEVPLQLNAGITAHEGIDDIYKKFNTAYKQLDVDGVAGLYTDTADYLPAGGKPMKGRAEIRASFAEFFGSVKQRGNTIAITFQITQREVTDKLGYDVGIYTLTTFKDGQQLRQGRGQFVVVTKKIGKKWFFQLDTYADLPPDKKQ